MTQPNDVCSACGEVHGEEDSACTERTRTRGPEPTVELPGYRIVRPLGAGAMGAVYLAEDVTLGRQVAIKFVSPALAADEDAQHRFVREARAMASVRHPNVVRIYSFGEQDRTVYIVMEHVEGESLRDHVRSRKKLGLEEALRITRDVASALEAAWAKGIVHRDVKPSNILLDRDGRVYVADFGLARPVVMEDGSITAEGALVGTPDYVSPEQARGERVDFRSDIYSLGIVLYEMLAGSKPFTAPTPVAVAAKHLHEPLPSLGALRPELRAPVLELVESMTKKDPGGRPASYAALRERIHALLEERIPTKSGASWGRRLAVGAAALAVSVLVMTVASILFDRAPGPVTSVEVEKLTTRGTVEEASLSDDGRYLAYVTRDGSSLWLKDLREKSEVRLVSALDGEVRLGHIQGFSPDASYVYYSVAPPRSRTDRLFRAPLIGGTPQPIAEGSSFELSPDGSRFAAETPEGILVAQADGSGGRLISEAGASPVAWFPDGTRLLLLRSGSLLEVGANGGEERKIAEVSGLLPGDAVSFRPDGKALAFSIQRTGKAQAILYILDVGAGTPRPLGEPWDRISILQWLPDGRRLLVNASTRDDRPDQIWLVSYPDGARRAIPGDSSEYQNVRLSADGKSVVATHSAFRSEILVSTDAELSSFERLLTGTEVVYSLCWTRTGEIIYSSNEASTGDLYDLYVLNPETQARRRLTYDSSGSEVNPAVSPDGRYVVFTSQREGESSIWRMNPDGTDLRKLATASVAERLWMRPQVSPDSRWVLYMDHAEALEDSWPVLRRVSIEGGEAIPLFGPHGPGLSNDRWQFAFGGGWSSRGDQVAFLLYAGDESGGTPMELAVSTLEGTITRTFPYTPESFALIWDHQRVQWSSEGPDRYLYFSRSGNLWRQALAGGLAIQLTQFDEPLFDFDWSPDGRSLVVSLWTSLRDVVRVTGF